MKPHIHAENSAKAFGGKPEDYIEIHKIMDGTKSYIGDHRHRVFAHNTWFISVILPKIFGDTIKNSDGKIVSVIEIGEQHIVEDLGLDFIPTPADYLKNYDVPDFGKPFENGKRELPDANKIIAEELERIRKETNPHPLSPPYIPHDPWGYPKVVD